MVTMEAYVDENDGRIALKFPDDGDLTLTFTPDELDQFIVVLMNIREQLSEDDGDSIH